MKYLKTYESFSFNKYQSFDNLSMMDLYEIGKWGLQGEFDSSGAWDCADNKNSEEKQLDSAIKCARDDFRESLNTEFPTGLKNFPPIAKLYRFITAIDGRVNKKHLGESWFADLEWVKEHKYEFFQQLQHLENKYRKEQEKLYLVSADIPIEKINIARTLWKRSANSYENEVVVKDDKNLKNIEIKEIKNGIL